MKPETRMALRAGRDFQPGFYKRMSEEERSEHRARDNGLIPRGPVVGARFELSGVVGITAADLDIEPPLVDWLPQPGAEVLSVIGAWRVATFHYCPSGHLAEDGAECFERVICLDRATEALGPIDFEHLARMEKFDEDLGALVEAEADAADREGLIELGGRA